MDEVCFPGEHSGAFVVGQFTLLLLLIPRFWQRGVVVSYWQQKMMLPAVPIGQSAASDRTAASCGCSGA